MSKVDIAAHIEKLLFRHDSLSIPGLGGFTATKAPAATDYIAGTIAPPAKSLSFSENLMVDDGILVQELSSAYHFSAEESRRIIEEFVAQTQQLLDQREIVSLPGVGRLYKNYMQKIQFLPDATNFSTEHYGLPTLQFSPLARTRESVAPAASSGNPIPATPATPAVPTENPYAIAPPRKRSYAGWWIGLAAAVLLGAGLWFFREKLGLVSSNVDDLPVVENVAPKTEDAVENPEKTTGNEKLNQPRAASPAPAKPTPEKPAAKPAAPTNAAPAGEGRTCILIVATLREKVNAERLEKMLRNGGHQVYSVQKSGYQVGITFKYKEIAEVQQKINALQSLTGEKNIWIKQK